ncbi:spindle and centriole-associated protein 1 isoform X2 [Thalassophryne amazonica]|uniref:spindle and centriole-associated protein 1 isoform X2 n=1 Tax=Thalassophryne amazonica TaxID=390379 RepID=UPI0014712C12|nr:spindle and centriole-associated protein 1 isoform X2 [Thalassophryne amazonica]
MSFSRTGRSQLQTKGKKPVRLKKTAVTRREWVSTVSDLSVHKLTPEELNHRHEIHKSHNKAVAQWELREKEIKRRLRHGGSPAPMDQASLSIIREVFSDQMLLQDVLARSDKALAVVKDLFADAPRRQTGHPNVTVAPNCDSDSALPVPQRPDPLTQLSVLRKNMMEQQVLNKQEDTSLTGSPDYQVIQRTNFQKMKTKMQSKVIQKQTPFASSEQGDNVAVTPCTLFRQPHQTALNASTTVKRVRSRQSPSEDWMQSPAVLVSQVLNPELRLNQSDRIDSCSSRRKNWLPESSELDGSSVGSLNVNQSSLGLLQTMLDQVQADLDSLTPDTIPVSIKSPRQHSTKGLTGFSVALVSTLGRFVNLLKQREEEAQRDAQEKRKLQEELSEQRGLIDALTAEIMTLRQDIAILQAGLQQQAELKQKLDTVVLAMNGLDLQGKSVSPSQESAIEAAVRQPMSLHHELLSGKVLGSCDDTQTHSSASSLLSLPCTSSLSLTSDPVKSQFCHESLIAEVANLSRQNELLRVQLCQQATDFGLRVRGSSASSVDQRRLNSSSTERIIPQSDGERVVSVVSSNMERIIPQSVEERLTSSNMERIIPQSVGERSTSSNMERIIPQSVGERSTSSNMERIIPQSVGERSTSSNMERIIPQSVGERSTSSNMERIIPQSVGERSTPSSMERITLQNVGGRMTSTSSNMEGIIPQSVGERTMSASNSTGGSTHLTQSSEGAIVSAPQVALPNALSVEQRLLELNRQSAAARSRLLELIEQQKQSISTGVSPIPPSAVRPYTAAGKRSPGVSVLLPLQEPLPHTGGGDRICAAGESFSQSLGGEIKNVKSQIDKHKEQKGWFSLSAHMIRQEDHNIPTWEL